MIYALQVLLPIQTLSLQMQPNEFFDAPFSLLEFDLALKSGKKAQLAVWMQSHMKYYKYYRLE